MVKKDQETRLKQKLIKTNTKEESMVWSVCLLEFMGIHFRWNNQSVRWWIKSFYTFQNISSFNERYRNMGCQRNAWKIRIETWRPGWLLFTSSKSYLNQFYYWSWFSFKIIIPRNNHIHNEIIKEIILDDKESPLNIYLNHSQKNEGETIEKKRNWIKMSYISRVDYIQSNKMPTTVYWIT